MMGDSISRVLKPKKTPYNDEYSTTSNVLGLGINGKVVECFSKKTNERFALKVRNVTFHDILYFCDVLLYI